MAIIKAVSGKNKGSIARVIHYIMKKEKTDFKLITGINCEGSTDCIQQMKMTKTMYKKEGGRQYKHYVLSFHPDDFKDENGNLLANAAEKAHEITLKFLNDSRINDSLEGFEIAVATHVDRGHLHSHIVVNSVNMETGLKYRQSYKDLEQMKEVVRDLEVEYCLHKSIKRKRRQRGDIVQNSQKGYQAIRRNIESLNGKEQKYTSWVLAIFQIIMKVLNQKPKSKDEYIAGLKKEGISTQWSNNRKYITYADSDNHKIRDKKLSDVFDVDINKEKLVNEFERNKERERELESRNRRIEDRVSAIAQEAAGDARRQLEDRERFKKRIEEQRSRISEIEEEVRGDRERQYELSR